MDRGYMGSDGKEIKLAAEAVAGLIKMNADENNGTSDKQFIKALMIGVGPLKMFQSVKGIPKKIKAFIKGDFVCIFRFVCVCFRFY